jgi:tetratricopeptide (TPR) repeat protein
VCFSPDGERLASGSYDRTAKIWSVGGAREGASASAGAGRSRASTPDPEGHKQLDDASQLNRQVYQLWKEGKYQEAIPSAEKALAIRQKILGNDAADTALSLFNLGAQYFGLKDYARAERLWQQAYEVRRKLLGEEHVGTKSVARSLARLREAVTEATRAKPPSRVTPSTVQVAGDPKAGLSDHAAITKSTKSVQKGLMAKDIIPSQGKGSAMNGKPAHDPNGELQERTKKVEERRAARPAVPPGAAPP